MFRLLAILFLFVIFTMQLMIWYWPTLSSFNQSQEINIYEIIKNWFEERYKDEEERIWTAYIEWGVVHLDIQWSDEPAIVEDIEFLYLKTGYYIWNSAWPEMIVVIPVLIEHEDNMDNNMYSYLDKEFEKIEFPLEDEEYQRIVVPWNNQYIYSWNNYYSFWKIYWQWWDVKEKSLYLWYLYTYCFLSDENYQKYENDRDYDFANGECSLDKATWEAKKDGSWNYPNTMQEIWVYYLRWQSFD